MRRFLFLGGSALRYYSLNAAFIQSTASDGKDPEWPANGKTIPVASFSLVEIPIDFPIWLDVVMPPTGETIANVSVTIWCRFGHLCLSLPQVPACGSVKAMRKMRIDSYFSVLCLLFDEMLSTRRGGFACSLTPDLLRRLAAHKSASARRMALASISTPCLGGVGCMVFYLWLGQPIVNRFNVHRPLRFICTRLSVRFLTVPHGSSR